MKKSKLILIFLCITVLIIQTAMLVFNPYIWKQFGSYGVIFASICMLIALYFSGSHKNRKAKNSGH
jgi:hypothetical protein